MPAGEKTSQSSPPNIKVAGSLLLLLSIQFNPPVYCADASAERASSEISATAPEKPKTLARDGDAKRDPVSGKKYDRFFDVNKDGHIDREEQAMWDKFQSRRQDELLMDYTNIPLSSKLSVPELLATPSAAAEDSLSHGEREMLARKEFIEGDYEGAIRHYDVLLQQFPKKTWMLAHRGRAFCKLGYYDQAIADCTKALQTVPDNETAHETLGIAHLRKGLYEEAVANFDAAIAASSKQYLYFYRGIAHERLGEFDQAFADEQRSGKVGKAIRRLIANQKERTVQGGAASIEAQMGGKLLGFNKATRDKPAGKGEDQPLRARSQPQSNTGKAAQSTVSLQSPQSDRSVNGGVAIKLASVTIKKGEAPPTPSIRHGSVSITEKDSKMAAKSQRNSGQPIAPHAVTGKSKQPLASEQAASAQIAATSKVMHAEQQSEIFDFNKLIELRPEDADAHYNRGVAFLSVGKFSQAADDFYQFLQLVQWHGKAASYAANMCALSYMGAKKPAQAHQILQRAQKSIEPGWPFPITQFLLREISEQAVLAKATNQYSMTTAKTYLGLANLLGGDRAKGQEYLRWVQKSGDNRMEDYELALSLLRQPQFR